MPGAEAGVRLGDIRQTLPTIPTNARVSPRVGWRLICYEQILCHDVPQKSIKMLEVSKVGRQLPLILLDGHLTEIPKDRHRIK